MKWQNIKTSEDGTHFLLNGKPIFSKQFIEVLKFHTPGLAPVKDESGSYHINSLGRPLYPERYTRAFGYYCNRAAVIENDIWFHLNANGRKAYSHKFSWVGNYQEGYCPVRNSYNHYFHIDLKGKKIYTNTYSYAGDYKDGIACVKTQEGFYKHIDNKGQDINSKNYLDLGVFHKNYATAKDETGWYHINKNGNPIYSQRFADIEPFYNGFALVTRVDMSKVIIDETGEIILTV